MNSPLSREMLDMAAEYDRAGMAGCAKAARKAAAEIEAEWHRKLAAVAEAVAA